MLLAAQVVITLCQIGYSGVTSRVFLADAFGAYTVALTATGLLTLLLTTGFPSYVLSSSVLSPPAVRAVTLLSAAGGLVGALLMLFGGGVWAGAWGVPHATGYMKVLALQVLLAGPGAVQLALLRREGRSTSDAAVQASSAAVGALVGIAAVLVTREPLALTVSPVATAVCMLLAPAFLRKVRYPDATERPPWRHVVQWSRRITSQNLGFWVLSIAPVWFLSHGVSVATLGQYSRASLLAILPSTALSGAMTRALQPYYRHLAEPAQLRRGISDAVVLAAAVSLPAFALLLLASHDVTLLLLGRGWSQAADFVQPLAAGYGFYVVFTVLANAAEMVGRLDEVKRTQYWMFAVVALVGGATLVSSSPVPATCSMLALSGIGLVVLLRQLEQSGTVPAGLPRMLLAQLSWVVVAALAGALARTLWYRVTDLDGNLGATAGLLVTVAVFTVVWCVTLPRQPSWGVARSRGLLPRRLLRSPV